MVALVVNSQERQTISVKGTEFVQKLGGGVLMNVLAYPAIDCSSLDPEYGANTIALATGPIGKLQFWFDMTAKTVSPAAARKYPLRGRLGTYKQIPLELTVEQVVSGYKVSSASQIADFRVTSINDTKPFEQLPRAELINFYPDLTIRLVNSTSIVLSGGGLAFMFGESGGSHGMQLTMITQKLEG